MPHRGLPQIHLEELKKARDSGLSMCWRRRVSTATDTPEKWKIMTEARTYYLDKDPPSERILLYEYMVSSGQDHFLSGIDPIYDVFAPVELVHSGRDFPNGKIGKIVRSISPQYVGGIVMKLYSGSSWICIFANGSGCVPGHTWSGENPFDLIELEVDWEDLVPPGSTGNPISFIEMAEGQFGRMERYTYPGCIVIKPSSLAPHGPVLLYDPKFRTKPGDNWGKTAQLNVTPINLEVEGL